MRLTIITINWNNRDGLKATVKSVVEQGCKDYEYIIIDGQSTDGSQDILKEYDASITKWISEPDSGIYNAMNKGVSLAHGDYVLFMNSGDCLHSRDTVNDFFEYLNSTRVNTSTTIIGKVNVLDQNHSIIATRGFDTTYLTPYKMMLASIPHQAAFIPRNLLVEMPYDESLRITADWKFFLEALVIKKLPVNIIPMIVADYDGTGISSNNYGALVEEKKKALIDLLPPYVRQDYWAAMETIGDYYHIKWIYRHPFIRKCVRMLASFGTRLCK